MPHMNIRLRPNMSATQPMGSNMAAATRMYEADTQLKVTAETWNSSPMSGRATLMPEERNVTRNPPKLAMNSTKARSALERRDGST